MAWKQHSSLSKPVSTISKSTPPRRRGAYQFSSEKQMQHSRGVSEIKRGNFYGGEDMESCPFRSWRPSLLPIPHFLAEVSFCCCRKSRLLTSTYESDGWIWSVIRRSWVRVRVSAEWCRWTTSNTKVVSKVIFDRHLSDTECVQNYVDERKQHKVCIKMVQMRTATQSLCNGQKATWRLCQGNWLPGSCILMQ